MARREPGFGHRNVIMVTVAVFWFVLLCTWIFKDSEQKVLKSPMPFLSQVSLMLE